MAAWEEIEHEHPLGLLCADADPNYRPLPELVAEIQEGTLDREVVPLLNALWRKGARTKMSCTQGFVSLYGGSRADVALLEAAAAVLPAPRSPMSSSVSRSPSPASSS